MANGPRALRKVGGDARLALTLVGVALAAGCQKPDFVPPPSPAASAPAPAPQPAIHIDLGSLTSRVGAKPGELTYKDTGPEAAVMSNQGTAAVRRVGTDRFIEAPQKATLFPGDLFWVGPHSIATLALSDNTVVQLAEETAVVVGNRAIASDPAASLGVLCGVARFSISPRARGEGAFLATAGPVVVGAKGTAFGVSVSAGGFVRVGVEHGEVDVAGPNALDKPQPLESGQSVVVDAAGAFGKVEPFKADDWGAWRYAVETRTKLEDAARLHANRLVGTESRLDVDYLALQKLATVASALVWQAAIGGKSGRDDAALLQKLEEAAALAGQPIGKGKSGDYKATALERAAAIEAVYRLAGEIARETNAALSDGLILSQLYMRHPREVADQIAEFGQEITAAVLYGKKLQLVAAIFLSPLRSAYYTHTPRGRAAAASLELPPSAFAAIKLPPVPAGEIGKRLARPTYAPPHVESTTRGHPVWTRAPKVGWNERLTVQPVPPRQGAWYLAPPQIDPKLVTCVEVKTPSPTALPSAPAMTADESELGFLVPPLPPPDAAPAP
jgi:hypothetical protein